MLTFIPLSNKAKAHFAQVIVALIFAINYWVAKELMPEPLAPRQIIFIRVFFAAVLFWLIPFNTRNEKIPPKNLLYIALASVLGVAANQIFFFEGLNLTTPVDASILHTTSPIIVLILARLIIAERISFINLIGILTGAFGTIILIVSGKDISLFSGKMMGNLFIIINTVSYCMYLVLIKPIMQKYHAITVLRWVFTFGLIATAPFTFHTLFSLEPAVFTKNVVLSLVYIVLATSMLAYWLTVYGLKYLKASSVGYYTYIQPVTVALIGVLLFAEIISWQKTLSAVLIFAGVYLVNLNKKPDKSN